MPPKYSREINIPIVFGKSLKDQFRTSPCEDKCPLGNSIQKMQALVEKGEFTEALRYIRAKNPFPGITGRVCPHFCMDDCNRKEKEACVNIRALERAIALYGDENEVILKKRPSTGKKVSIIGGGPAGLSAAYYMSLLGHEATIYEAQPLLGGVPRYGVPNFRLPRYIVDNEIGMVLQSGVRAHVNTKVGVDITFSEITDRADAVIIATGATKENALPIENAEKAIKGVEFLRNVSLGNKVEVGKRVLVMGGGGVAFDCALTASRLGASEVHIMCLENEDKMLAPEEDLMLAKEVGIKMHNCCTMASISLEDDKVTGINYNKVCKHCFDETGALELEFSSDGLQSLACDTVIFAVGMKTDVAFLEDKNAISGKDNIQLNPRQWILVDEDQKTNREGIFAAGDVSSGPSSIAQAVGDGRSAAFAAHEWLTGEKSKVYALDENNIITAFDELGGDSLPYIVPFSEVLGHEQYEEANSVEEKRKHCAKDFAELFDSISREEAMQEAARCMHCGHCKSCGTCVDDCPGYILQMDKDKEIEEPFVKFADECWHCANCRISCPCGAIGFEFPLHMQV